MSLAGLFANERVELLDWTIVTMSAQRSPHVATVHRLHRLLTRVLGDSLTVRLQAPIVLDDWSEPEPDVVVCAADPDDYAHEHPAATDVVLVCEVSLSSLAYDRSTKSLAYAANGIPEYWIVDVEARVIEVLADAEPATGRYRREQRFGEPTTVTPGGAPLAVADILPPR